MRFYELTYAASPEMSEEEMKTFAQKVSAFVAEEGGTVNQQPLPEKRRLGYPIKGKTEAFLASFKFALEAGNIENIEKKLKAEAQILRYAISAKKSLEKAPQKPQRRPKEKILKAEHDRVRKSPELQKIELKEIDKKIEEILSE